MLSIGGGSDSIFGAGPEFFFILNPIEMDYSQYIRLKNEAANVYVSRTKTVDASFLTMQKRQKAAYSGYNNIQTIPYYKGGLVVNNTLLDGTQPCPANHQFTQGFTSANRLSQQEDQAFRKAGAAVCGDVNYATASPGLELLNSTETSTILNAYNTVPKPYGYGVVPGVAKPYGYGTAQYFPNMDLTANCSTCTSFQTPISFPSG